MIYGYLILTSGVLYDWKGSYNERIAPYPILEVSKDISTEVQSVMYRNTIFRHAFEMKEYEAGTIGNHVFSTINNKYRFAFRMFRNIELTLTPLGWHIHQDEEEMDLPHLLRCLINILASRDNRLAMELKITFVPRTAVVTRPPTKGYFGIEYHKSCSHGVFEPCQRGLPGTAEEQQEELKAAWMRAHLLHLGMSINRLKSLLAGRDYSTSDLKIGSNNRRTRASVKHRAWANNFPSHKLSHGPSGQGTRLRHLEDQCRRDWTQRAREAHQRILGQIQEREHW